MSVSQIIVIAHNIRSTHNVGSIFRTCEGFGVSRLILSGYTPYPKTPNDTRLPHISDKLTRDIKKTALGAEALLPFSYEAEPNLASLREQGFTIIGLEQSHRSILLPDFTPPEKIALILGEEVSGIPENLLSECDAIIEIPMKGQKESFNVSVATGVALYALTT